MTEDEASPGPRITPKMRTTILLFVVLPCVVSLMAWVWIKSERGAVRARGDVACVETKHDEQWCKAAADKHHERCMELTFKPATKTAGQSFDTHGYVECLGMGPEEYWRISSERAADRRRAIPIPTGPSYH